MVWVVYRHVSENRETLKGLKPSFHRSWHLSFCYIFNNLTTLSLILIPSYKYTMTRPFLSFLLSSFGYFILKEMTNTQTRNIFRILSGCSVIETKISVTNCIDSNDISGWKNIRGKLSPPLSFLTYLEACPSILSIFLSISISIYLTI